MQMQLNRRMVLRAIGAGASLAGMGLLGACGGGGGEDEEPIAPNLLSTTADNQAATFRNVNRIYDTRVIHRGYASSPLRRHSISLETFKFSHGGTERTVDDYMRHNRTAGVLVLKNGAVALERYGMGNDEKSRWTSFSVAKSIASTLVGAALKDGYIESLDDPVTKYVPALVGSAYEQNTIRQLLRMSSGVAWDEGYDPARESDIVRLGRSFGKPGQMMELMKTRARAAAPGTVFNYSTGESYVLASVVAGAIDETLSSYLSRKIWSVYGMEEDAYWVIDAPNGIEFGGGNVSATLRDYGRFAQFYLNEGKTTGNVLPEGWLSLAGRPDTSVTDYGALYNGYPLGYGYQWWTFPDGTFTGQGIFGQFMYVNAAEDVVAIVWSAWRSSWNDASEAETYSLINGAVQALR